jgi:glycosyltransferase involved in cell wall biosynthesis
MNFWLLHVGEDLPIDESPRLYRYGYLAQALMRAGHRVTRWAPTFHHYRRRQRASTDAEIAVASNYSIQLVYAPGYRRNVSLARVRSYRALARRFAVLAKETDAPDLIVAAIPSLEWCSAAVEFGRIHKVPVVVDVRDLWPDIYLTALPRPLRPVGRLALTGLYRQTRRTLLSARAIAAVSESYLNWSLALAGRPRSPVDCVIPLGYESSPTSSDELGSARRWLLQRGVDPKKTICLFAGCFEKSYDVETIVSAARIARQRERDEIQFVLCGDGSKLADVRKRARDLNNVVLLGRVNTAKMSAALSLADIGLAAYSASALQSLPNKVFEYLANGLAIVSSLRGEVAQLLERHECGITYRAGDAIDLARQIIALAADRSRRELLQRNARQLWWNEYQCDEVYDRFAAQLQSIAASHGSGNLARAA